MSVRLTLGPVLYNWSAERLTDFYAHIADEADVDRVHLGEVVCGKRAPFTDAIWPEVIERLEAAGKEVVISLLALPSNVRERKILTELAGDDRLVEINDVTGLAVRAASLDAEVSSLSGGNLQKLLLGKCLAADPSILLLNNPTRGVDAGSREDIYASLHELTAQGAGILLITDDLAELIGLSDRILIMRDGRIAGHHEAPPDGKPSEEVLVAAMSGSRAVETAIAVPCNRELAVS